MSDPISLLADPIISKVIDEAYAFGKNKYHELYGVKSEIEKLTSNLSSIKAVLSDAERCLTESKSEQLVDWLTKLRDAALDVEDILESYATDAAIREKNNYPNPLAWVSSRSNAADKIKKVVARIGEISQERSKFHFREGDYGGRDSTPTPQTARIGLREMSFLRDTSDIVGREEEKNEIVTRLLSEEQSDGNREKIPVLPIIGMGGLGKTTLAQLVYNDERVYKKHSDTSHFKVAMWMNVSVDSSVDGILKGMVEILTEMRHDMIPRSSIKSRVLEVLDGKRFLLVLDDVWPERLEWEPLHDFLKLCPKGSKILVTSRSSDVSRIMGALHMHSLGHLPEEQCWELFAKRAFIDGKYTSDLEEIGRDIIRRCDFLPLAVKAMAGLLRGIDDVRKWERISRNGVWQSEQNNLGRTPSILPALKLSYDNLPSQLKQCFAYCSIFPKGYMFDENRLIKLWITEGYVQPSGEDKPEEVGSDYFDQLLTRSFFQILDIDNNERYKMHDLMHDLAKSVSSGCLQMEEDKPYSIAKTTRHVSFLCKDVQKPTVELLKAQKLRTLLLPTSYPKDFGQTLDNVFRAMNYLRVLDLSSSTITDLPKSIGELKLLRYLDLSRTQIRKLPNAICNLHNLQVLNLLQCLWLSELPKELGKLRNLRHLELDEMFWYKCSTLPPRIGGLTNLHNFHSFHVLNQSGYGIEELKGMNDLEGILRISKLENTHDAKVVELKQKESIRKLVLEWSRNEDSINPQDPIVQETVLEDLEPHQALQELQIHRYKGSRLPSWMSNGMLQNLYKISLNHCVSCRILSIGSLPRLRELCIKGMSELVEWPETLYNSLITLKITKCPQLRELPRVFPNLRVVKIKECDALKALPLMPSLMFMRLTDNALLEDWHEAIMQAVTRNDVGENVYIRRCSYMNLLELKIVNCSRLQELPQVFFPQKLQISGCTLLRTLPIPQHSQRLQCLELDKCNNTGLIEAIPSTGSLYSLIISNIINLACFPKLPHLPGLKALYIRGCQDLVSFSPEDRPLQNLTSLKILSISNCRKLVTFPDEQLPTSIECLSIENCFKLQSFHPKNCLSSLVSLKDLYLVDCPKLEFLPEDGLPTSLQHLCI